MSVSARDIILQYKPDFPRRHCGQLYEDTSDFMRIEYGDVIKLDGQHYLTLRNEGERKFGLEDPKFWVKRCKALERDESVILKLVFHEDFTEKIGGIPVRSYRSEHKEARILDLVKGDARFMQGFSREDVEGNLVRVLDLIRGKRLDLMVDDIELGHEAYFHERMPEILAKFIECCQAIAYLHQHNEKHGDIRSDHIWVESGTKAFRWIDFDYTYDFRSNPWGLDLFGLGNILLFIVGKGLHTAHDVSLGKYGDTGLNQEDFGLIFKSRILNLRKLFPYVPKALNDVLMHFSQQATVFYDTVDELVDDLRPCLDVLDSTNT